MATKKIRHLVTKPGAAGPRHFWQPTKKLQQAGWPQRRLVDDGGVPIVDEGDAMSAAERINRALDLWRKGEPLPAELAVYAPRQAETGVPAETIKAGTVEHLALRYRQSIRFLKNKPKTRNEYRKCLKAICAGFGDVPPRGITRKVVQRWYAKMLGITPALLERLAAGEITELKPELHHLAMANANMRVARLLFSFALNEGDVAVNPFEKPGLIGTDGRIRVLSPAEVEALVAAADALGRWSVGDAVLEAYYLGQRQGDCLVLPWIRYQADDKGTRRVRLRQSKTGALIDVPATPWLVARLEQAAARTAAIAARVEADGGTPAPTIVVSEETGAPYKGDNFRHVFAEVRELAFKGSNEHALQPCPSVADAWFMDLRDTAVTNLAAASCTIPEICSITGHTERSAYDILKHYLALTGDMADAAIAKLVAYEERRRAKDEAEVKPHGVGKKD